MIKNKGTYIDTSDIDVSKINVKKLKIEAASKEVIDKINEKYKYDKVNGLRLRVTKECEDKGEN